MTLQHLRSSTANKRPDPTAMADGQIALNTAAASPGLFYKDSAGNLVKAGPVHVGSTAPNVSPASGGTAGNSTGEAWLDTSGSNPLLKIWGGAAWQTVQPVASGTVVSTADTGSVTSTMIANGTIVDADVNASAAIAGTKISPNFGSQNVVTTGTSTAASFIPTSSTVPTNGVYLPAANSVAISTNGTGRLFIDSSGNVGVGTSSPDSQITISRGTTSAYSVKTIRGNRTNQGIYTDGSGVYLFGSDSTNGAAYVGIAGDNVDSNNYKNILFGTYGSERMRLDSSGRLGIGTSSVSNKLHLSTTGTDGFRLAVDGQTYYHMIRPNGDGLYFGADDGNTGGAGADIRFNIKATERMRLTTTGLGIGTTNPTRLLTVQSTDNANFCIKSSNTGVSQCMFGDTDSDVAGNIAYRHSDNAMTFEVNSSERARIDSSGRLLVGTSSVSTAGRLFVQGNTFSASEGGVLHLMRGEAATAITAGEELGNISFTDNAGNQFAVIAAQADAAAGTNDYPGRLTFSTCPDSGSSPVERMRIGADGQTIFYGNILPSPDNNRSVGSAFLRWSTVYAATGTINTSDANLKQDIEVLEQAELNVATAIKGLIKKFRFIDAVADKGDDARIHVGVIAQEVEQAFIDEGLDPRRYALFCEDTLEDGSKRLGIRYDELLAFVIAAL